MNTAIVTTILSLVELAIKEEPVIEAALRNIFSKPEPTAADWQAVKDKVSGKSYGDLVTNSELP